MGKHVIQYSFKWNIDSRGAQYVLTEWSDGEKTGEIYNQEEDGSLGIRPASVIFYQWDAVTKRIGDDWIVQPVAESERMKPPSGFVTMLSPYENYPVNIDSRAQSIINDKLAQSYVMADTSEE